MSGNSSSRRNKKSLEQSRKPRGLGPRLRACRSSRHCFDQPGEKVLSDLIAVGLVEKFVPRLGIEPPRDALQSRERVRGDQLLQAPGRCR